MDLSVRLKMITLSVADTGRSARFYAEACETETVVCTDTHGLLVFPASRTMLYLQLDPCPAPIELVLEVQEAKALQPTFDLWQGRGLRIAEAPRVWPQVGMCFVALDPDGHRLRVVAPVGWQRGRGPAGTLEPAPRDQPAR